MKCRHKFMNGFGMFTDALVCVKCGYSINEEDLPFLMRLFCKIINNSGYYEHYNEYPFVRKPNRENIYYFNRKGRLNLIDLKDLPTIIETK